VDKTLLLIVYAKVCSLFWIYGRLRIAVYLIGKALIYLSGWCQQKSCRYYWSLQFPTKPYSEIIPVSKRVKKNPDRRNHLR